MNAKVWHLSYFEGVFLTQMIRMFENANARMVRMLHTMHVYTIVLAICSFVSYSYVKWLHTWYIHTYGVHSVCFWERKKDILTSSKTKIGPWDNWFTIKMGYLSIVARRRSSRSLIFLIISTPRQGTLKPNIRGRLVVLCISASSRETPSGVGVSTFIVSPCSWNLY